MRLTRLGWVVIANLVVWTIGAGAAIQQRLPSEFGAHGDPGQVAQDFFASNGHGTAAAPPLIDLVILALFGLVAALDSCWGVLGDIGLVLLGLILLVSFLGEPHTAAVLQPATFEPPWAFFDLVTVVVLIALVGLGLVETGRRLP